MITHSLFSYIVNGKNDQIHLVFEWFVSLIYFILELIQCAMVLTAGMTTKFSLYLDAVLFEQL